MSIRLFLAALLSGVFVVSLASVALFTYVIRTKLSPFLTTLEQSDSLQATVIQTGLLSLTVSVFLLLFVYWAVGAYVARPIRDAARAMDVFASDPNTKIRIPENRGPREVRRFARAFAALSVGVEKAHQHDVEISRVKSDFISTAAHQLRTPLTGIRWAIEALEKEPLTDTQKAILADAKEKSKQLVAVVGTLLDISSIESGKYKYTLTQVDFVSLVDEVARDFSPIAAKAGVQFLFEKSGIAIPPVKADRERIRWVLNNLVENAIRYTPQGGMVRITLESSSDRAYLKIRDTGIGIAPEDRGNIFERFYRAPNAVAKENGGSGLGLYIARTIATDHGGELSFASNAEGPGTTFTLTLPYA